MNNYHIYEEQAKGKYSVIFKARKKKKLQFVAIKRLQKTRKAKVYNEAQILSELTHPNIIKFYDFMQTKNHMWEITEYCPGGDLLKIIEYDKQLPEQTVRSFMLQIMAGMQFAHSKGIVICDIKPASILVNEYGSVKIGDFGSAQKLVDLMGKGRGKKKGTPSYMAPQLFDANGVYSFQSDLWALGCMMYELGQGNPPFVSSNFQQIAQLARGSVTPRIEHFSPQFNDLLCSLLQKDPGERIQWRKISKHRWIRHELPQLQIPEQTHFMEYLKQRSKQRVEKLRVSHNFENENYGKEDNMTASNRREVFEFQNYEVRSQDDEQEYYEEQEKMADVVYVDVDMKKNKTQQKGKEKSPIQNKNIGVNRTNEQKVNQGKVNQEKKGTFTKPSSNILEDSSNINSFLETLTSKPSISLQEAISHQSDSAVKPIIGNKDIEVIESINFNKNQLGFSYIQPQILAEGIINHEVDEELKKILDGMRGEDRVNVLGYFESIVQNSQVANELFKSNYIPYYMSLLKSYKQSSLRAKICEVLGLLIRHATSIDSDILKYGIITGFIQTLTKDKNQKVRRKAMAALGQLLFYGATQVDEDALEWDISLSLITTLLKILKNPNQDQIVKIYCCKTIENITAQAQRVGLNFSQIDTLIVMVTSFANTKNEGFKTSIMCTIHHMISLNQTLRQIFLQKMPIIQLIEIFNDPEVSFKTVQIVLWIFLQQFLKNQKSRYSKMLFENKDLIRGVCSMLESGSSVVKGRTYLFIYFLLNYEFRKISLLSETKLFHSIQRHAKQTGKFESQALQFLVSSIYENFHLILKLCAEQLQSVIMNPSIQIERNNYILIISQMQGCSIFEELFNSYENIQFLVNLMNLVESKNRDGVERQYMQHFKNHYFLIMEKIFTNDTTTEKLQEFYCSSILSFLIGKLLKTSQQQIRYSCIKYIIYVINFCLSEDFLYDSTILTSTNAKISSLIVGHLIPQMDVLFDEGEAVANMMFKLMGELFRNRSAFIVKYWQSCRIDKLLPFYGQNATINVQKTIEQIFSIPIDGQLESKYSSTISQFWGRTIDLLQMYKTSGQELFLQYPLSILTHLINYHPSVQTDQHEIDNIFELVVPLQGHQDTLVRGKAESLIEALLNKNKYSQKGLQEWKYLSKKGMSNLELFTQISGLKPNIKVTQNKQVKNQKESRYNN